MTLGELLNSLEIGGSHWKRNLIMAVVLLAGCWFGWREYKASQVPTDGQHLVEISLEQLQNINAGIQQVLAVPAQVRREVRQGVQAVVVRVGDYDSDARGAELERIIGIGRDIRSGRGDDNGD